MLPTPAPGEALARAEAAGSAAGALAGGPLEGFPVVPLDFPDTAHRRTAQDGWGAAWPASGLPALEPARAGGGERRAPIRRPAGERHATTPTGEERSRPAILFIDDQIGSDNELVWLLELEGFAVECVPSGAEGLARALARPWDAILLDLHLPDIPGLSVLERLMEQSVATPVIALTGWYLSEEYEQAALRLGAAAFRFKPLDALDLADLLRQVAVPAACTGVSPAAEPAGVGGAPGGVLGEGAWQDTQASPPADVPALHDRLRGGDGMAVAPLAEVLLPGLARRLRRRFPGTDEHLLAEAAEDAFLNYVRRPARFEPGRGVALDQYLFQAACRDVVDRLRSDARRRVREVEYARRLPHEEGPTGAEAFEIRHDREVLLSRLADSGVVVGEAEQRALRLLLNGEHSPEAWVPVLRLAGQPSEEGRGGVKRLRDRLLKRLRRWWRARTSSRA